MRFYRLFSIFRPSSVLKTLQSNTEILNYTNIIQ
nr:MAG TPA: hypothetical protein [Caudoviricetes sp.]